jgi:hypothetical protein
MLLKLGFTKYADPTAILQDAFNAANKLDDVALIALRGTAKNLDEDRFKEKISLKDRFINTLKKFHIIKTSSMSYGMTENVGPQIMIK